MRLGAASNSGHFALDRAAIHLQERKLRNACNPSLRIDHYIVLVRDRKDASVEGPMHRLGESDTVSRIVRPIFFLSNDVCSLCLGVVRQ